MSTRSVIAQWTDKDKGEWAGQYHHWDGYPTALGATLYHECRRQDMTKFLDTLLQHSWATINGADWRLKPGPQCHCHGDRHEKRWEPLTQATASDSGCEWAYVLDPERRTMTVLECSHDGWHMVGMFGQGAPGRDVFWVERGVVFVDNPEPDWEAMQG